MDRSELNVGMLVVNPRKPEWGPGRVCPLGQRVAAGIFRDLPDQPSRSIALNVPSPAPVQEDDRLDNLWGDRRP